MSSSSQALEYLEQQPLKTHTKLYEQPSTVLAIFRCMLPHLAKTLVMAMLYMTGPFPAEDLDSWFRADGKKDKGKALTVLDRLHIMNTAVTSARTTTYALAPRFATSLREALTGGGSHRSFGVPASTTGAKRVTVQFLDQHATKQWENILFYMVGSTVGLAGGGEGVGGEVGEGTKALLKMGEFIHISGRNVRITKKGFEFVLRDTNAQVWSLLIVYLQNAPALSMSETDVLSFLFLLGSLSIGQDYTTSTLSPTQLQMLEDLSAFGIVYRPSTNSTSFYPTRLAVTLTSDSGSLQQRSSPTSSSLSSTSKDSRGGATEKGFIIIETNYRLYAYTHSLLSIAILSLFTKLTTRFPNLVSGKLTRDSISRAVKLGISSSQIISYLQAHAHPQMMRNTSILPPTVMDQIRLWEYEGERVETTSGYVMKEFESEKEYRDLVDYAESLGVLVWRNDARRCFFVDQIDQIRTYLARKKK